MKQNLGRMALREDLLCVVRLLRRHCEERSDEAIHASVMPRDGLLRFARNDGGENVPGCLKFETSAQHTLPSSLRTQGPIRRGRREGYAGRRLCFNNSEQWL